MFKVNQDDLRWQRTNLQRRYFTLTILTFYDTFTRNVRMQYRFYFADN